MSDGRDQCAHWLERTSAMKAYQDTWNAIVSRGNRPAAVVIAGWPVAYDATRTAARQWSNLATRLSSRLGDASGRLVWLARLGVLTARRVWLCHAARLRLVHEEYFELLGRAVAAYYFTAFQ